MDKMVVRGGVPLRGDVVISGAKNAALPILFATLLTPGEHRISNVPHLRDIATVEKLLRVFGARVEHNGEFIVDARELTCSEAPYDLVSTMRASVLALGPLLARTGTARVSLPGGCAIGTRPIDLHLKGLEAMGAKIDLDHGYIEARVSRLRGAQIYLDFPTVGGTENLMMAAVLAEGTTVLDNAAREPEIIDLAAALTGMGAKIEGAGSNSITITGVKDLDPMQHRVMPDRIEAGTYLIAAAMTGGDIRIYHMELDDLEALVSKLREAGVRIDQQEDHVRVRSAAKLRAVDLESGPYPAFPTDMQAQFMALMTLAEGTSAITESVFENRFMHVSELNRLGANISIRGNTALVKGVADLTGAPVMATDLRASASLVLAALAAGNTSEISRIYHLDRGYEKMEVKLQALGARIERVAS